MSLPTLTPSHVFGINSDVRNNICYLDETNVIYPAGFQIVQYNFEQKTQRFIPVHVDGEMISTMMMSPFGSLVAIGLKVVPPAKAGIAGLGAGVISTLATAAGAAAGGGQPGASGVGGVGAGGAAAATTATTVGTADPEKEKYATVQMYDIHTGRRRKVFTTGDAPPSKDIIAIAFTNDNKYIIAQGGAPDWCLYMWSLDKGKMVTWTRSTTNPTNDVITMTCNHHDATNTQICVTGTNLFRVFRFVDGTFKLAHQNKIDKMVLCHTWVTENRVIAGTQDSKILIIDAGELVLEISYVVPNTGSNNTNPTISTINSFSTGLVAGLSTGVGVLFDKTDDNYLYKKNKEFLLEEAEIACVALNPHEDSAVATMKNSQIYLITFDADTKQGEEIRSDRLAQSFHSDQVIGMDVSINKPLLATSGADKSVRIWNYIDNTVEVVKYFDDVAQCVAIHPNGLYLLAGFPTTLKLMAILIDDIRPFWDTNIRGCKECRFSNGGQYFAATWGTSVMIYDTWSFEIVSHLKSQTGKIKSIAWSNDDTKILTYTFDGVVSQWNLATFKKEVDLVVAKNGPVTTATMNHSSKLTYAVSRDGVIHEIQNGAMTREINVKGGLPHLLFSKSGQMIFGAGQRGTVRALRFPFGTESSLTSSDYIDYAYHASAIIQMCTSFDDQFLFTCGDDGCIWVFRIQDKDGRAARREKDWTYSDEILVTKSDLRENYKTMNELKQRVDELKAESDAQLKTKDNVYNQKIKEVSEKYATEVELLKQTASLLKMDSDESEHNRKTEMEETKRQSKSEILEMEASFNAKMKSEAEKYAQLQQKMDLLQEQWNTQMTDIETIHKTKVQDTSLFYRKKIHEKQDVILKSKAEFQHRKKEFEEMLKDIEADVEKESLEIVYNFESKLKEERESLKTIREENLNMKSKFEGLTQQIDDHKRELTKSVAEEKKLHAIIRSLENDIVGIKKEMQDRDDTIMDKEKRIYDLKKKNQELEKFKFVLDYKIIELHKQVEPREKDTIRLTDQIKAMSEEIHQYHARHSDLDADYKDMLMRHHATQRDRVSEEWRNRKVLSVIQRFQSDLRSLYKKHSDMNDLKHRLTALYHKYWKVSTDPPESPPPSEIPYFSNIELLIILDRLGVRGSTPPKSDSVALPNEEEIEAARTREQLEKTIEMLRAQLTKDEGKRIESSQKMMSENITLISEINSLRLDLQNHRDRLQSLRKAKSQRVPLSTFIHDELKHKTIRQLVDPHVPGGVMNKTVMPLPPIFPPPVNRQS